MSNHSPGSLESSVIASHSSLVAPSLPNEDLHHTVSSLVKRVLRTKGYPLVKTMHHFHFTFSISSCETKNLKGSMMLGGDIWAYPGLHFVHVDALGV